jgi:hypothetical protein
MMDALHKPLAGLPITVGEAALTLSLAPVFWALITLAWTVLPA